MSASPVAPSAPLIAVRDLAVHFPIKARGFFRRERVVVREGTRSSGAVDSSPLVGPDASCTLDLRRLAAP